MTLKLLKPADFACRHTGENRMDPAFLERLDRLFERFGKLPRITSGYRSPTHPSEASKPHPGAHTLGLAADIATPTGADAFTLVRLALDLGFSGIGIKGTGPSRFIHLDCAPSRPEAPRPTLWTYP